jgi:hypothetical protein
MTNPELQLVKRRFAYGPGTSKTVQYALNTLRKHAEIGVCDTTPTAASYTSIITSRSPSHSWTGNIFRLLILVLIVLAPVATAVDIVDVSAANIATSVAVNVTSSIISTTNIHTSPTDNGGIASTIASWTSLSSSIAAAAGKTVTLTLSAPFDMTGFQSGSSIHISTAQTAITIVGNGAVFDAGGKGGFYRSFFYVGSYDEQAMVLVMSNVTLQNGNAYNAAGAITIYGTATLIDCTFSNNTCAGQLGGYGGAIEVFGTAILTKCIFSGNIARGYSGYGGGAIFLGQGTAILTNQGTAILTDCTFSGNAGGALYFSSNTTGLLKNCSLLGTVSDQHNDIARDDTTANVTFACADGEVGTPVQMSGTNITKLPALTCTASYSCDSLTGICKSDKSGVFPSKQACSSGCTAQPTPAPCQVPRNCGQHNNSVVCGHTFTGCEFVCGKGSDPLPVGCCHASIHADEICNGCVEQLCKPLPPLPPPVTTKYACITTPSYHCVEFSSGTFSSATECEKGCQQPPSSSTAAHGPFA